jgi:hypothetical protein
MGRRGDDYGWLFALAIIFLIASPFVGAAGAASKARDGMSGLMLARTLAFVGLITLIVLSFLLHWPLWGKLTPAFLLTFLVGAWIGRAIGSVPPENV